VEKKHELLAEETEEQLEVIVLSEQDRSEISAMIDRCYEAFEAMFDVLSDRIRINMDRRPARWKSRLEELSSPTGAV
jgi:hypothetical protein